MLGVHILVRINIGVDITISAGTVVFVVSVRVLKHVSIMRCDGGVPAGRIRSEPLHIASSRRSVSSKITKDNVIHPSLY